MSTVSALLTRLIAHLESANGSVALVQAIRIGEIIHCVPTQYVSLVYIRLSLDFYRTQRQRRRWCHNFQRRTSRCSSHLETRHLLLCAFFSIQLKVASPVPVRVLPTFTNLSEISRLHRILPNQLARQWYLCCCNG